MSASVRVEAISNNSYKTKNDYQRSPCAIAYLALGIFLVIGGAVTSGLLYPPLRYVSFSCLSVSLLGIAFIAFAIHSLKNEQSKRIKEKTIISPELNALNDEKSLHKEILPSTDSQTSRRSVEIVEEKTVPSVDNNNSADFKMDQYPKGEKVEILKKESISDNDEGGSIVPNSEIVKNLSNTESAEDSEKTSDKECGTSKNAATPSLPLEYSPFSNMSLQADNFQSAEIKNLPMIDKFKAKFSKNFCKEELNYYLSAIKQYPYNSVYIVYTDTLATTYIYKNKKGVVRSDVCAHIYESETGMDQYFFINQGIEKTISQSNLQQIPLSID